MLHQLNYQNTGLLNIEIIFNRNVSFSENFAHVLRGWSQSLRIEWPYADMRARKKYSFFLFGNHKQDILYGKIFYINANCDMVEP